MRTSILKGPPRNLQLRMTRLPRLYAILDSRCFSGRETLLSVAEDLSRAGVLLMQYRNKRSEAAVILSEARELRQRLDANRALSAAVVVLTLAAWPVAALWRRWRKRRIRSK